MINRIPETVARKTRIIFEDRKETTIRGEFAGVTGGCAGIGIGIVIGTETEGVDALYAAANGISKIKNSTESQIAYRVDAFFLRENKRTRVVRATISAVCQTPFKTA